MGASLLMSQYRREAFLNLESGAFWSFDIKKLNN